MGLQLSQSQIIEDIIGVQKNDTGGKAHNRFKRPQSAMVSAIRANVVADRHQFKNISADIPIIKKQKLDATHFVPDKLTQSLPFEHMSNYEQKADFYSPKAENNNVHWVAKPFICIISLSIYIYIYTKHI